MQRLKLDEYAQRLCAAKEAYNYPAVTCYDFDAFLKGKRRRLHERKHTSMSDVENLIRKQLVSQDTDVVKDGLSNVLYWGYATQGIQRTRVQRFRSGVTTRHISQFRSMLNSPRIDIHAIEQVGMPEYSRIAFISKLLMFIDPSTYPVLDNQIADFGRKHRINGLSDLKTPTDKSIRSTNKNRSRYADWARLCKQIANRVNSYPSSPCKGLRAVDVERAIYWNIREGQDFEAILLLAEPA